MISNLLSILGGEIIIVIIIIIIRIFSHVTRQLDLGSEELSTRGYRCFYIYIYRYRIAIDRYEKDSNKLCTWVLQYYLNQTITTYIYIYTLFTSLWSECMYLLYILSMVLSNQMCFFCYPLNTSAAYQLTVSAMARNFRWNVDIWIM